MAATSEKTRVHHAYDYRANSYRMEKLDALVVSDNRHILTLLKTILRTLSVGKIRTMRNPATALTHLENFVPDLVICDRTMSPMNGLDLVKTIRFSDSVTNRFVPIIMLSSDTEIHHVLEARDSGITEFLAKPLSPKVLYGRIVSIIERPRPFIRTKHYFGPCRRRRLLEWLGDDRRGSGKTLKDFGSEVAEDALHADDGDSLQQELEAASRL